MTWKTKWQLALALLLVVGLGTGISISRTRSRLAHYKAGLRAHGGIATLQELKPPPIAPEANAAPVLESLLGQLPASSPAQNDFASAMRLVAPARARVAWRQAEPLDALTQTAHPTNLTWQAAAADLQAEQPLLAAIRQALTLPHLSLELDYSQGFALLLPHLATHKALALRLARAVTVELHQGDLNAALADLRAMLSLARLQAEEPVVISQLVALAIVHIAFGSSWEALLAPGWQDSQLAQLQADWQKLAFIPPMQRGLGMERTMIVDFFAKARRSPREFDQMTRLFSGGGVSSPSGASPWMAGDFSGWLAQAGDWLQAAPEHTVQALRGALWRSYWSYQDELHYLEIMESFRQSLDQVAQGAAFVPVIEQTTNRFNQLFRAGADTVSGQVTRRMSYLVTSQVTPSLASILNRLARTEAARQMAIAAIGLSRYRLAHHSPPSELAALAPQFLPSVPLDPMDGQPLRYRPSTNATFLLYSVGEDGRDGGGDANPVEVNARQYAIFTGKDWVWPLVATPEEIAAARQKKHR